MPVKSWDRGHEIYYDTKNLVWRYSDTNEINDHNKPRPCKKCGCIPTPEGYDACLGYIEGAKHACCGHGIRDKYVKYD